jgi:hypothetical protein
MQYIELIKRISGVMVSVQSSGEGNRKIENCVLGNCEISKVHIV